VIPLICENFPFSGKQILSNSFSRAPTVPLAHLNFLSGVNCYDIGSSGPLEKPDTVENAFFATAPMHHNITFIFICVDNSKR
jgi:hypothetical protein